MRLVLRHLGLILLTGIACAAIAACDTGKKEAPKVDPNLFPTDYKAKIVTLMRTYLTDRAGYSGALVSPPFLRPFGADNRYVACVRLTNGSKAGEKMAVCFGGQLNQFIDADPGVCATVAYEPFLELERAR